MSKLSLLGTYAGATTLALAFLIWLSSPRSEPSDSNTPTAAGPRLDPVKLDAGNFDAPKQPKERPDLLPDKSTPKGPVAIVPPSEKNNFPGGIKAKGGGGFPFPGGALGGKGGAPGGFQGGKKGGFSQPGGNQGKDNLAGSVWSGAETLAGYDALSFEFRANNQAIRIDKDGRSQGSYQVGGATITIRFKNLSSIVTYRGTIKGNVMSGTATNGQGNWNWTVTKK